MTTEEQLKTYAAYLPYGLDVQLMKDFIYPWQRSVGKHKTVSSQSQYRKGQVITLDTHILSEWIVIEENEFKPVLYDLSYLTQEIEHEGRVFIPIDVFEITDDSDSYSVEYDHGNIKLIRDLESIAENNLYFDIQFLPFEVVQRLISWHFNIFGIPAGEFIDKATLKN